MAEGSPLQVAPQAVLRTVATAALVSLFSLAARGARSPVLLILSRMGARFSPPLVAS